MTSPDLLMVCVTSFIAVFILLTLLAIIMRGLTAIFPQLEETVSTAQLAAITTTYQTLIPGSKVTIIEEIE